MKSAIDKDNKEWREIENTDVIKTDKGYVLDPKYKDYEFIKFSLDLNSDGYYSTLSKITSDKDKLLSEEEIRQEKLFLSNCGLIDDKNKKIKEGRKLIHKELFPAKSDYKHDFDRGTVHYTPKCRNYSYHKVIIPDGTVIKETNFTQRIPYTLAVEGKNLTFIDCNLANILCDVSWVRQGCNNNQIKHILTFQGDWLKNGTIVGKMYKESIQVGEKYNKGVYKETTVKDTFILNEELNNQLLRFEV